MSGTSGAGRPKISLAGVSKSFAHAGDHVRVLDRLSFPVYAGEFVSVVGPSGCGKTTLLNLVAGFVVPDEGEVRVDGRLVTGPEPNRGVVFQQYAIFPWLTVAQNIEFGLTLRAQKSRCPKRADVVRHYIDLMGLRGFETAFPKTLSGGMKQRVAIARAYAVNPEVLLMDEPFAALDAQTRDAMQEFLLHVHAEEQKTVLFVTHSVEEAIYLSNRVVVLGARPARVREEVESPLDYPRTRAAKFSTTFTELRHHIEDLLRPEQAISLLDARRAGV